MTKPDFAGLARSIRKGAESATGLCAREFMHEVAIPRRRPGDGTGTRLAADLRSAEGREAHHALRPMEKCRNRAMDRRPARRVVDRWFPPR